MRRTLSLLLVLITVFVLSSCAVDPPPPKTGLTVSEQLELARAAQSEETQGAQNTAEGQTQEDVSEAAVTKTDDQEEADVMYVLNTNTKKFHEPVCSSVGKMKAENREDFSGSREEAIALGYSPCGNCKP